MSMMWMPMPGQTWPGVAASFLGMWVLMTVAMMLPSLTPTLWRYREAVARSGGTHPSLLTGVVGAGYFFVWVAFGMITFALGTTMVATVMHRPAVAQAVPITVGIIVLIAGALQFTAWKAHHLACSREIAERGRAPTVNPITAWQRGVHLGLHCGQCCGSLMVVSLVVAGMDLRVMAVVGAAIVAERVAPAGERVARAIGVVVVASGLFLIARAAVALLAA